MTTTNTNPTDEATAWLEAHGFTHDSRIDRCYRHRSGNAAVDMLDENSYAIYALTHDRARLIQWEARLTHVPLPVFAATVTAAIA